MFSRQHPREVRFLELQKIASSSSLNKYVLSLPRQLWLFPMTPGCDPSSRKAPPFSKETEIVLGCSVVLSTDVPIKQLLLKYPSPSHVPSQSDIL